MKPKISQICRLTSYTGDVIWCQNLHSNNQVANWRHRLFSKPCCTDFHQLQSKRPSKDSVNLQKPGTTPETVKQRLTSGWCVAPWKIFTVWISGNPSSCPFTDRWSRGAQIEWTSSVTTYPCTCSQWVFHILSASHDTSHKVEKTTLTFIQTLKALDKYSSYHHCTHCT